MPRTENLARSIRRYLSSRTKTTIKSKRSTTALVIASVALVAAVAFTVSVESRSAGWLRKALSIAPQSEVKSDAKATSNSPNSVALSPATPLAPTVTATKTDALLTDVDNDTKADPGDTLRYTVGITAAGEDATGVVFSDTLDPNTAFVPGSVMTTPLARNDSYNASGNIRIQIAAPGVLANDSDVDGVGPALVITAETKLSAQGGNVTLNADGSFSYNPAPGFEGSDSFTYTLVDGEGPNDTGTVNVTVTGMIWFINNNAASCLTLAAGCGRLTNPFSTLAAFAALNNGTGNNPAANDNIFVYESATDYTGSLTLLNGQKFIGQDATATLSSISGVVPPAGSDPLPATSPGAPIVNITSASVALNVAQNNILRGFTGGNAVTDINGVGFVTLNISDVTLNGTGRTLALDNGTLTGTFGSLSSTDSATTGLTLISVGGSLTTGSTSVVNPAGIGISVNTSGANLNFANTSVTGSGGAGISLTTNTGTATFGSLTITPDANQKGLLATNNTNTITTTSGVLTTSGAAAVDITRTGGTTPLNIILTTVSTSGGPNGIILSSTSGSFTVAGNGGTCTEDSLGGCTGGHIQNITGADVDPVTSQPAGTGVVLRNATNVSLTRIRINGNQNYGIHGLNVNNFTMANSVVHGVNGTNVSSPFRDSSIRFDQLTGTNSITNSMIRGGFQHNLLIDNQSGSSQITVSGNTIRNTSGAVGDDGFHLEAELTAVVNAFITNNSFVAHGGDHFNLSMINTANVDLTFTGNSFAGGHAVGLGQGMLLFGATFNGTFNYDVSNNGTAVAPLVGNRQGGMINVNKGSGTGTFSGRIQNNFIGNAAVVNSGSLEAFGIIVGARGAGGSHTTLIDGNTIRQYEDRGIVTETGEGAAAMDATITNNTVSNFSDPVNSLHGIHSDNGILTTDTNSICMDIRANSVATAGNEPQGGSDIRLRKGTQVGMSLRIPGLVGTTAANAQAKILADNPTATSVNVSGANFAGGAACTQPTLPAAPLAPINATATEELSAKSTQQFELSEAAVEKNLENVLWAARGENKDPHNVPSLTSSEVSAMVEAAITRWSENGLSAKDFARFQSFTYEVADLPEGQLATLAGNKITLDITAAGHGWFFDTTPSDDNEFDVPVPNQELQTTEYSGAHARVDLLTVLMRQLGSTLKQNQVKLQGPQSWLMENTLEPGTRRAPTFKAREIGKAKAPKAADVASAKPSAQPRQELAKNVQRNSRGITRRHHAKLTPRAAAANSLVDVMLNIGILPAGKTITITFDATVDDPFPGPGAEVCNQGTVSGTNFSNVLTDDPSVGGAADPTCTPIDLQADLEITAKTDTPDPVIAGNNITYTINFQNNGPNAAGATVTDAVPANTTFVSAQVTSGTGWTPTTPAVGGTGNVVFTKALVAKDETATFEIVVKVGAGVANGSTITNTATASTSGATDPVPENNSKTAMTAVIAQADLSITKTDGATTEIPGTSITYTITVSNAGPSDANGVSVADTFPGTLEGVTFTSVAAGGATGNTANGAGNISDTVNMPAGSSITYTVNATIDSAATGELTNTATVTEPAGVTDPNQANNSATDTDTLTPQADLSITKTDGATDEVPGTSISYTIVVTNNGPSDANNVAVADTFPSILDGVSYTSVAAGGATGNTAGPANGNISDTLAMPAGSSVTYTVTATIQASATGELTNTATVTAPEGVEDTNLANNSATDTDTLTPQADLSITKTDGATDEVPGTSISYTIVVTNSGPSDASGVSVTDNFPAALTGVSYTSVAAGGATGNTAGPANGNISDTLNMPTGSSVTYTVSATIASSATGSLSNTATVTAPGGVTDPTPGNNSATDTDTLTPSADVAVDKSGPASITPGNNISYTISVTNAGPSDAVNLSFSDAVPTGTTFVSVTTPAGWTRTDAVPAGGTGTITFTAASIAAGAPASSFTLVVNANLGLADGTIITNTVTVGSATADPVPANNSDTVMTAVQNNADLEISKSVSPTGPNGAGASVTYTVNVKNNGPSPASMVTFTDVVPAGLVVNMQTNPSGWTCNSVVGGSGTITCTKASMADEEMATLTVVATINCGQANGSTINNTATISAVSPADGDTNNNTAMASFTVNNPKPVIMASLSMTQLPQNSHDLVNVGLMASATDGPCGPPTVTVQVFADEDDQTPTANNEVFSPDAKDLASGTLRLRAERVNSGDGRVYLIVVKATDEAGQTSFATFTAVVPKSNKANNVNAVLAQAAAAKAFADANLGAAPAGYFVIGDGPIIGPKQ
jgi:uncharacterized repeat protein (TIGR01451 family)